MKELVKPTNGIPYHDDPDKNQDHQWLVFFGRNVMGFYKRDAERKSGSWFLPAQQTHDHTIDYKSLYGCGGYLFQNYWDAYSFFIRLAKD